MKKCIRLNTREFLEGNRNFAYQQFHPIRGPPLSLNKWAMTFGIVITYDIIPRQTWHGSPAHGYLDFLPIGLYHGLLVLCAQWLYSITQVISPQVSQVSNKGLKLARLPVGTSPSYVNRITSSYHAMSQNNKVLISEVPKLYWLCCCSILHLPHSGPTSTVKVSLRQCINWIASKIEMIC